MRRQDYEVPVLIRLDDTTNVCRKPCSECPWRKDAQPGRFGAEHFRRLANTAYDMNHHVFTCHKSLNDKPLVCAGFLLRGAAHNLTVRMNYGKARQEADGGGLELFDSYRQMAIANFVDENDPVLAPCRD